MAYENIIKTTFDILDIIDLRSTFLYFQKFGLKKGY